MNNIQVITRADKKVLVINFPQVEESAQYLKQLREEHDHTPVIILMNPEEKLPAIVANNCCGGHLLRNELHLLENMIQSQIHRHHDLNCLSK